MRVIALKDGYDGSVVRKVDDEFDMPDGSKATWFKPVVEPKPVARKAKAEQPTESDVA